MRKVVFDIETDGLLPELTKVWCICLKDIETGETLSATDQANSSGAKPIVSALRVLSRASIVIGHNITGYDLHVLNKIYKLDLSGKRLRDTLCMSKLFDPERPSHSLESYGVQFGRPKPIHEEWDRFSEEMLFRCQEDVEINSLTYRWMVDKSCLDYDWVSAIELEQLFQYEQTLQELEGVDIDVEKARALVEKIDAEVTSIDDILLQRLPKRCIQVGKSIDKPFKKDGTLSKRVEEWFSLRQ